MSIQFSLGKRLIRAAVSLGFLGCLIAAGTVPNQASTRDSSVVASKAVNGSSVVTPGFCGKRCANLNNGSHLMLTVQVEIGLPQFGVAFEEDDSLEMLRVDMQRCVGGIDWVELGSTVALKAASHTRPNISPPLLV